jgi:hypothetical protein
MQGKFDYVLCLSVLHHSLSKKDLWKVLVQNQSYQISRKTGYKWVDRYEVDPAHGLAGS